MMQNTKFIIGADHGGYDIKEAIIKHLLKNNYNVEDVGCFSNEPVDYPDYSIAVSTKVSLDENTFGILCCSTGIGMSISANKFPNINAAVIDSPDLASKAKTHNNINIICLAGNTTSNKDAIEIVDSWMKTDFEGGGRHERRLNKIHSSFCNSNIDFSLLELYKKDNEVYESIKNENYRQQDNIELIASENFTSKAIQEAQGSILTNKYAEGYPGKRWYGGCENVDKIETLAIERAKELFKCSYANVQPHSGSQANTAVYFSVLDPGDKILTMDLSHGGHLTHGHFANFSGKLYQVKHYGVSKTDQIIDYDELAKTAIKYKPKMITAGASAYSRDIDFKKMREIADSINAFLFVDMAHIAGLVVAEVLPSPIEYAHFVTTTTHKSLRGPRGGVILTNDETLSKKINSSVFPGVQGGPLMHVIAAKAVCFKEALEDDFKDYQKQIVKNSKQLVSCLSDKGYKIISGGTDNHLFLMDLRPSKITGKLAQETLDKAGITVNKNSIPYDTENPFVAGGIRIGTPAITTRGMKEDEMIKISNWIHEALSDYKNYKKLDKIRKEVQKLNKEFNLP